MKKKVLVTGAGGKIGSAITAYLEKDDRSGFELVLSDIDPATDRQLQLDVADLDSCRSAMAGIDTVLHLAGVASPDSSFEDILPVNIVGTHNVFRAAALAGVKRIVYASSAHVVEGYPVDYQVRTNTPVRPKNLYGVSKAFGEALGAYYAYQTDLEVIAIRIGAFEHPENWSRMGVRDLSAWIHPRDLCALVEKCLEVDLSNRRFAIVHGISNNRYKRLDLGDTKELTGYQPASDAFETWGIALSDESTPL